MSAWTGRASDNLSARDTCVASVPNATPSTVVIGIIRCAGVRSWLAGTMPT